MDRGKIIDELIKIEDFPQCIPDKSWEDLLDTIGSLCEDEKIMTEAIHNAIGPHKKAKEIALEAVTTIYANRPDWAINWHNKGEESHFIRSCNEIYQWLIKE